MIKHIELAKYNKRSDLRSFLTIMGHLALVFAPVYIAVLTGPSLFWIALWLWFGLLMNGLLNLMHECAHYHVFSERRGSNLLGRWVLGPLLVADFDSYRWRHWEHHTHLGVDGDTKDAYLINIQGSYLFGLLLRCLTLIEALRKFGVQTVVYKGRGQEPSKQLIWLGRAALVHGLFFASLLLFAGPVAQRPWPKAFIIATLAYSFIYGYGLASITIFAATLRAIAEHQLEIGEVSSTGRAALRNFSCGLVARLIFGAYGFAEHASHHCQPGLPYYHLVKVTEELASYDPIFIPKHRYWGELTKLAKRV
jgi:fatty acid desaturase